MKSLKGYMSLSLARSAGHSDPLNMVVTVHHLTGKEYQSKTQERLIVNAHSLGRDG
jgi:hypothetical protein